MTNHTHTPIEANKGNRLQVRIDEDSYHLLEKAAHYTQESLSRFIRNASLKKAQQIIQQHEALPLSDYDWDTFLEALTNPPQPNQHLKKALTQYKRTIQQ